MKILVTGGAGYIGKFMVQRLLKDGHEVLILDNFERGHFKTENVQTEQGSILDRSLLRDIFGQFIPEAVIHFAGLISMAESVENPYIYFETNTYGSMCLLEEARNAGVMKIIFSSTAGVYGNPESVPIPEDHPKNPTNPYGESKYMFEKILSWYQKEFNISSVSLRYFNASGAALDGSMGEEHSPETHIIPLAVQAALKNEEFTMYGNTYDTRDGTCVRDYIHILDLVEAHVLALDKISAVEGALNYNVGTGEGFSNKEIVEKVKEISGVDFPIVVKDRRPGDADQLIAQVDKIRNELGFDPKYSDLNTIIDSAWKWHSQRG